MKLLTSHKTIKAAFIVGILTFVVMLITMVKEQFIAYQFGPGDALDAFLIAFLLPSLAINIVAGSLNAAFIPVYIQEYENEGQDAAKWLFSNVMVLTAILLIGVCILLAIITPYILPILGSGFSPQKLTLTRSLFFCLLPTLVISGLSTIWAAVLNAKERFALAALAPIMVPVAIIVFLFEMGKVWGIYALAIGTVSGFVLQIGFLAIGLKLQRIPLIPRWYGMNLATKQVIKQYVPMIAGAFLMSSTGLVDKSMAAMLGPGSVSALSYGNKVIAFILGICSTALGTAVLPYFSRMVAVGDWISMRRTLKTYACLILLVTVPLTLILLYFSKPLVSILFVRGSFTEGDAQIVGHVQAFYLLQVPFYILGTLLVRLISSLKLNQILMWGDIINISLNIILNYVFMRWLGVAGIALSTSVVYLISVCYLLYMLLPLMRGTTYYEKG